MANNLTDFERLKDLPKLRIPLEHLQRQMRVWQQHNFPGREAHIPLLGVGEELGELNHAYIKSSQGIRTTEDHQANMVDSVADLIIFLADFCNAVGIDMQDALDTTWVKVRQRDWQKNKETGV